VGDLDLATSKDVTRRLRARCTGLGPGDVLLVDLSRLGFVDVCGAEALAGTAGELRRRGAGIVLRGTRPLARTVLTVCGIDELAIAMIEGNADGAPPRAATTIPPLDVVPSRFRPDRCTRLSGP